MRELLFPQGRLIPILGVCLSLDSVSRWGYGQTQPCGFYTASRGLNSGPYDHRTSPVTHWAISTDPTASIPASPSEPQASGWVCYEQRRAGPSIPDGHFCTTPFMFIAIDTLADEKKFWRDTATCSIDIVHSQRALSVSPGALCLRSSLGCVGIKMSVVTPNPRVVRWPQKLRHQAPSSRSPTSSHRAGAPGFLLLYC